MGVSPCYREYTSHIRWGSCCLSKNTLQKRLVLFCQMRNYTIAMCSKLDGL